MSGPRRPPTDGESTQTAAAEPHSPCASLLVVGKAFVTAYPLPEFGVVVIGRGEEADLTIKDSRVSRRHARLDVAPGRIGLTDLGSHNGTHVDDRRLEAGVAVELGSNDTVMLGGVTILLRPRAEPAANRQLCTAEHFDELLAQRCDRDAPFAVIRIAAAGALELAENILEDLRPGDVIGTRDPDELMILLPHTAPNEAAAIHERVRRHSPPSARVASARFPHDGATPVEILLAADPNRRAAPSVVAVSARMRELFELADRVAPSPLAVLLLGETGVGKEVFAERLHARSDRSDRPLLRLNCAALSESLLEAELFGYERGAFTGAGQAKPGLLETADGGTVFLDEIGELPLSLQAKLLRVLEDSLVRRVGGLEPRRIDVRIVSATHRALEREAETGGFRRDLFYRLNGVAIEIPPLRERREEIAALVEVFVKRAADRSGRAAPACSPEALGALEAYAWPGNLRELRNALERAVLLCGDQIETGHLPAAVLGTGTADTPPAGDSADDISREWDEPVPTLRMHRDTHERDVILDALERCHGNQTRAAKLLGIARSTLVKRLEKYDLPRPRKGDG